MVTPILVPAVGCANQKLIVSLWLARAGEPIIAGDRVVELLIPGITFDVEAPCSGMIASCECPSGTEVQEGKVLGWIEQDIPEPL